MEFRRGVETTQERSPERARSRHRHRERGILHDGMDAMISHISPSLAQALSLTQASSLAQAPSVASATSESVERLTESLAREFATLPLPSLVPAFLLLAGGLLLLVSGRHLLRPVLVVTIIVVGALLGAPILGALAPDFGRTTIGRVAFTFAGGVLGLIFVASTWRLLYGCALGVVVGFAASFIALIGVDAGIIDARAPNESAEIAVAMHPEISAIVERAPTPIRPLIAWADARWHAEPPQARTFLGAAAAGGAFIGLTLGAWMPQASAAFLTSLVGGIFTLVGAMPFLARFVDRFASPIPPIAWLFLWLALALLGWLLQTWRGDPDEEADGTSPHASPVAENDATASHAASTRETAPANRVKNTGKPPR